MTTDIIDITPAGPPALTAKAFDHLVALARKVNAAQARFDKAPTRKALATRFLDLIGELLTDAELRCGWPRELSMRFLADIALMDDKLARAEADALITICEAVEAYTPAPAPLVTEASPAPLVRWS